MRGVTLRIDHATSTPDIAAFSHASAAALFFYASIFFAIEALATSAAALRGGTLRKVFDDRVREYEILSGRGPSEIRFVLHGSYCGGHGNPSCEKTRRITSEPFKFGQPN
jgi:hypothetical protein